MDSYLETFRTLLKNNKKIILTHHGIRYKARTITSVPYIKIDETDTCPHCGYGSTQKYVAKSNNIIFYVWCWDGCLTYDPDHTIDSFDDEVVFKEFLEKHDSHSDMLEYLFPKEVVSEDIESSTDSY